MPLCAYGAWEGGKAGASQKTCQQRLRIARELAFVLRTIACSLYFVLSAGSLLFGQDSLVVPIGEARVLTWRGINSVSSSPVDTVLMRLQPLASVGELLSQSGGGQLLSYGAKGSIITARIGGLSPDHIDVNWNGLPLESPTLGLADLSLIPAFLMAGNGVTQSSSGTQFSGGGFAGSLNMRSGFPDGVETIGTFSSMQNSAGGIRYGVPLGKFQFKGGILVEDFLNKFDYDDPYNSQLSGQQNKNDGQQASIIQSVGWRPNERDRVSLDVAIINREVQLPDQLGGLFTPRIQRQQDSLIRGNLQWQRILARRMSRARIGYVSDFQHFLSHAEGDPDLSRIDSRISSRRVILDLDNKHLLENDLDLSYGIRSEYTGAEGSNFASGLAEAYGFSVFASLSKQLDKFEVQLSSRTQHQSIANGLFSEGQWGAAGDISVSRPVSIRGVILTPLARFSLKNRIPDFNERFWIPGGNPNISPEQGWQAEFAGSLSPFNGDQWELTARYQRSHMWNWIQWVPGDGFFEAVNYRFADLNFFQINARITWKDWTLRSSYEINDNRVYSEGTEGRGLQLAYTPANQWSGSASYQEKGWVLWTGVNAIGTRFANEEQTPTAELDPIHQWSASISKTWRLECFELQPAVHYTNILDQNFEYMRFYTTPGRVFSIQLKIKALNHKKNEGK